jgi:hypothetical protein
LIVDPIHDHHFERRPERFRERGVRIRFETIVGRDDVAIRAPRENGKFLQARRNWRIRRLKNGALRIGQRGLHVFHRRLRRLGENRADNCTSTREREHWNATEKTEFHGRKESCHSGTKAVFEVNRLDLAPLDGR